MAITILVTAPLFPSSLLPAFRQSLPSEWESLYRPTASGSSKDVLHGTLDSLVTDEELATLEVIFGFSIPSNLISIQQAPRLKLIQLASSGVNHIIDSPLVRSLPLGHPLVISSAAGIHAVPISEHVLGTVLALNHHLPRFLSAQSRREWQTVSHKEMGEGENTTMELRGRTMGVLGYGHIGRETARMAKLMGMNVVAANRAGKRACSDGYHVEDTGDVTGLLPSKWFSTSDPCSMSSFLACSDVVVNTLPSTSSTRHFLTSSHFSAMKPSAIFVNVGRGDTIDQGALIEALKSKTIRGASLDVTDPEPLPSDCSLWDMPNVIITPHVSGMSEAYFVRALDLLRQNVERVCVGGKGGMNAVKLE